MKDKKMLYGIALAFIFLASVGFSYAYFTASIVNKDVKDQVVQTGTLELTYTDGPEIKMENIKPGQTIAKKVTVKNTGTLDASYNLVWQELNNTISNDEMVISATCKRLNGDIEEESCEGVNEDSIINNIIKKKISIEPGIIHEYNVTITFKETNLAQNYNQGKTFSGVLGINEYKAPEPVYCTFDGDLAQGTEYVNGQYTYRYMQEGTTISYVLGWSNMTTEGWGVQLTDKTSPVAVTSEVCTYINDKPVVSYANMFYNSVANKIDVSGFDTSNVINMKNMFSYTQTKTLDVSSFNTSNVTNMNGMFSCTRATILDVSGFDTSNVTDMSWMFNSSQATTLDLSSFNTSNVTNMSYMFDTSKVTTLDLSSFNTSNVTDMSYMFDTSKVTTLDLSSFNTSNVTNMIYMFYGNPSLTTIYASSKFVTTSVTDGNGMFLESPKLVGGAGTVYDANHVDKEYARVDGGTELPGYFTLKTN